jgi:hypothetical protein
MSILIAIIASLRLYPCAFWTISRDLEHWKFNAMRLREHVKGIHEHVLLGDRCNRFSREN